MEIKIICHSCDGLKFIHEKSFPSRQPTRCDCPECEGEGFVMVEQYDSLKKEN